MRYFQSLLIVICITSFLHARGHIIDTQRTQDSPTEQNNEDAVQFRHVRCRQVWEEAQNSGRSYETMEALKADLLRYEDKFIEFRVLHAEGNDRRMEKTKHLELQQEFNDLLKRHGIETSEELGEPVQVFSDMRLNKLWKQASSAGHFSAEELEDLKREFEHHEHNLDEFRQTTESLQTGANKDDPDFGVRTMEGKLHLRKITDDYKRLELLTVPAHERSVFVEPRVHQMWMEAINGNFTGEELVSLREELRHFEEQLQQSDDKRGEAIQAELKYHISKSSGERVEPAIHQELSREVMDIAKTISQQHGKLSERIKSKRHREEL
ncbi:alpha-2-macroglobulin receptor-associated protein-like [Glandiceps talaboti]